MKSKSLKKIKNIYSSNKGSIGAKFKLNAEIGAYDSYVNKIHNIVYNKTVKHELKNTQSNYKYTIYISSSSYYDDFDKQTVLSDNSPNVSALLCIPDDKPGRAFKNLRFENELDIYNVEQIDLEIGGCRIDRIMCDFLPQLQEQHNVESNVIPFSVFKDGVPEFRFHEIRLTILVRNACDSINFLIDEYYDQNIKERYFETPEGFISEETIHKKLGSGLLRDSHMELFIFNNQYLTHTMKVGNKYYSEMINGLVFGFFSENSLEDIFLEFMSNGQLYKIPLEQCENNFVSFTPAKNLEHLYNNHIYNDYALNFSRLNDIYLHYKVVDDSPTNNLCFIKANQFNMMQGIARLMWST